MKTDYWELQTPPPVSSQDAFCYTNNVEIPALNKQISTLSDKQAGVNTALNALKAKLPAEFSVIAVDGPRYWQSNDPVILITGEDAEASPRYGGDGDGDPNGNLACRLSTQIINSVSVSGKTPLATKAANLPALTGAAANALPPEALPLISETFFVDPDRAPVLAKIAGATLSSTDLANLTQTIKSAQQTLLTGVMPTGSVTFSGVAPSPVGLNAWSEPWIPLMLQWEVHFYPMQPVGVNAGAGYRADFISSNFAIDPNDIHLKPTGKLPGGNYQSYQGSLVLAGNPQINLASQVDRYFKNHPDGQDAKELEQIKDRFRYLRYGAQALDGFNQQFLMRGAAIAAAGVRICSPRCGMALCGDSSAMSRRWPASATRTTAALPQNSYNPLRTGSLQVVRLRLIDAFGQVREINNPTTIVASSLKPPSGADGQIFLPPRIAQPARLLFRWISATDDQVETNSHPAATPVCGWVLFNHLDTSLMIYGADGAALGSLNVQGPLWQSAPGAGAMTSNPTVSLANANRHLRTFVMSAYAQGANFLTALLGVIDAQMTTINPLGYKQNQGLSLLIGQPLALVRASLRLELLGLPMLDESWPAFTQAVQASNIDSRSFQANLVGVRFPGMIGRPRQTRRRLDRLFHRRRL